MKLDKIVEKHELFSYIACQPLEGNGFDEVQQIMLAYMGHQPVALLGDPGVGKTQALKFVAKNILDKKIYRHNCSPEETVSDLLGSISLEAETSANGGIATKTAFKPGDVTLAMQNNCIGYLDEFNQLKPGVQKGLNSALEQQPSVRVDSTDIEVGNDYMLFVSINPHEKASARDFDRSVNTRMKKIGFDDLDEDLMTRIAMLQSGIVSDPQLLIDEDFKLRGVYKTGERKYEFAKHEGEKWVNAFSGEKVKESVLPYLFYDKQNGELDIDDEHVREVYAVTKRLVGFGEDIKGVIRKGTEYFSDDFVSSLGLNKSNGYSVDPPSPRELKFAVEDYEQLTSMGAGQELALDVATQQFVESIVSNPKAGGRVVGQNSFTFGELVGAMAKAKRLISDDSMKYNSMDSYTSS